MAGAGHPLVAHPVGPLAVEVLRGGFGLGLGGKHRLLGTMTSVLGEAGSPAEPSQEAGNGGQWPEKRSTTPHGQSINDDHFGRGAPLDRTPSLASSPQLTKRIDDQSTLPQLQGDMPLVSEHITEQKSGKQEQTAADLHCLRDGAKGLIKRQ